MTLVEIVQITQVPVTVSAPQVVNVVTDTAGAAIQVTATNQNQVLALNQSLVTILQPTAGPQGPPGADGASGAGGQAFVQPTAPAAAGEYLWVQTQIGISNDMTFWVEDGT